MTNPAPTPADRFWPKVDQSGECWVWTGYRTEKGYGVFFYGGHDLRAHRVAWSLVNGPIPDGSWVLHRCDNPPCVRPDHLFLSTPADNQHDSIAKASAGTGRFGAGWDSRAIDDLAEALVAAIRQRIAERQAGA